jgi:hypothetical protein
MSYDVALLEFHHGAHASINEREESKQIALNIFEWGLKKFKHEPAYVISYLDFVKNHFQNDNSKKRTYIYIYIYMNDR